MPFTKGLTPWNKGKKHSLEARRKMSISAKNRPPSFLGKTHTIETRQKLSSKLRGKTSPNKGKKASAEIRIKQSMAKKANWRDVTYRNRMVAKQKMIVNRDDMRVRGLKGASKLYERKPTSIEVMLYGILSDIGLKYEKQKLINNKFCVDAYIPGMRLAIEADGDYWHNLDRIKKKDRAERAYLEKCGYKLIRLTEQEIRNGSFKTKLGGELNCQTM